MNIDTLSTAIDEATRFLTRAKRLYGLHRQSEKTDGYSPITGTREAGDVKRASMDLSRALSALRRAG